MKIIPCICVNDETFKKSHITNERSVSIQSTNKIQNLKLFVYGCFMIEHPPWPLPHLLTKIWRCEIARLYLEDVKLTYEELKFLMTSFIDTVSFANLRLEHTSGELVQIEEIISLAPNAARFT